MKVFKQICALVLSVALLMALTGCCCIPTGKDNTPEPTAPTAPTAPTEPADTVEGLTLEQLRQQLHDEGKAFAVAYLGYMTFDNETVYHYIEDICGTFAKEIPFIAETPETNIIATASQGEVYCVVLAYADTVMEVCTSDDGISFNHTLFEGSSEEPFLLVCNADYSPDMELTITAPDGNSLFWEVTLDEYLFVEQPRYANGTTPSLDFSPYNALLASYYEGMVNSEGYEVPTADDLIGTSWSLDGFDAQENYYGYHVTFHEDTADVRWNPGYGEDCEYLGAAWSLQDGDTPVLTMDFGEFAGERRYNLVVNWEEGSMYIAVDTTGEPIYWDSERQYRFLLITQALSADAVLGSWEQAFTLVEGYMAPTEGAPVTLQISDLGGGNYSVTCTDPESTSRSFSDKAMVITEDGDTMGFGDAAWIGEIDYTGPDGATYALALVNDALVLRNYWLQDGAMAVSYQYFQKID